MSRPFLKANPTNYSKLQLEVRPPSFVEGLWQNEPSSNPNLKPEVTEWSQISQFQNPTQSEQELLPKITSKALGPLFNHR